MKKLFLCSEFYVVAAHIFENYLKDKSKKVLFIDTAAETIPGEHKWVVNDRKAFVDGGFNVTDFTITGKSKVEIKSAFNEADIIFSTGGNSYQYLYQIQQTDSANLYRDAVLNNGKIYIGGSAGSIITSPDISSRFNRRKNVDLPAPDGTIGLGLVNFIVFPHWGRKDFEESYLKFQMPQAFKGNSKSKIILLTDNQYVRVVDEMYQIIDQTQ